MSISKMIKLGNIPIKPGVYLYRNSEGEIIYVGKAINLKKRVSQYFQRDDTLGPKTARLVSQIASVETKIVGSEIEALVLEANLIKKYRPKYNSLLKDDKSYLYICITKDQIPLIFSTHQNKIPSNSHVYGPFPSGAAVKSLLRTIRRIFPFYSQKHSPKPCLYCHLGLCPGPAPDPKSYRQTIGKIKKIFNGNFKLLQRQLRQEIKQFTTSENFELAIVARDQLQSLNYIVSGWRNLGNLFETINLSEDKSSQAINELSSILKIKSLNRLECYDISQLGNQYFVGSMVVWQDGQIDKSQYKKFKIKTKFTPDDQYMIKEIVYRRLKHPEWGTPDLIIVDGGKPQVSAVSTIYNLQSKIYIIGLAKKQETIIFKNQEINLPRHSSALRLLQSLRDEAHRFANRYRRQLLSKSISES